MGVVSTDCIQGRTLGGCRAHEPPPQDFQNWLKVGSKNAMLHDINTYRQLVIVVTLHIKSQLKKNKD